MDRQHGMAGSREEDAVKVEASGEGEEKDLTWLSGIISSLRPGQPSDSILVVKLKPETSDGQVDMSALNELANREERSERIGVHYEVLTSNSQLFSELYQTAREENTEREITINIKSSEEAALVTVIHFMYNPSPETLPRSVALLLDVIKIADMFEVASCVTVCSDFLSDEFPMTLERANACLELHSKLKCINGSETLFAAAQEFLVNSFGDITLYWRNTTLLHLPLSSMKALLASDALTVPTESVVFRLVRDWAARKLSGEGFTKWLVRLNLSKEIVPLLRFAHMSTDDLSGIVNCDTFDPQFLQDAIIEALVFKAKVACSTRLGLEHPHANYVDRSYQVPVDVTVIGPPMEHCSVIVRLSRSQCRSLLTPDNVTITTAMFRFNRRVMHLQFERHGNNHLELSIVSILSIEYPFKVKIRVAARSRQVDGAFETVEPVGDWRFERLGDAVAIIDPLRQPFGLMVTDPASPFFLDDVLFLRVDLNLLVIKENNRPAKLQLERRSGKGRVVLLRYDNSNAVFFHSETLRRQHFDVALLRHKSAEHRQS